LFATTSETKTDSNEKPLDSPIESRAAQPTALDLVKTLLEYSPRRRLKMAEVLKHGWLIQPENLLLPLDHPGFGAQRVAGDGVREWFTKWHGKDLGFWLRVMLGKSGKEDW
jgi:serine/threonine protein kinase